MRNSSFFDPTDSVETKGNSAVDILKAATEWTKAEVVSSAFFILFGALFLAASWGFWQMGRTELSRAFPIPAAVAGMLLLIIGLGIFFQSYGRITSFADAFNQDAASFLASELSRADSVLDQYQVAVFRVIPLIIAASAIGLMLVSAPLWRASLVTVIAMMSVIVMIDVNANARLLDYKAKLQPATAQN